MQSLDKYTGSNGKDMPINTFRKKGTTDMHTRELFEEKKNKFLEVVQLETSSSNFLSI